MEKEKIIVIGSGIGRVNQLLEHDEFKHKLVVSPEQAMESSYIQPNESMIYNTHMPLIYGEKQFICKGKHQYREVKTKEDNLTISKWVCQCGRKL